MDLIGGIVQFANLSAQEQALVIKTLRSLQSNVDTAEERYVLMDVNITEESAKAKEYFNRSFCSVPTWIYSNINWKQVYKTLVKNGFLVEKEDGVYMKLKDERTVC